MGVLLVHTYCCVPGYPVNRMDSTTQSCDEGIRKSGVPADRYGVRMNEPRTAGADVRWYGPPATTLKMGAGCVEIIWGGGVSTRGGTN